MFKENKKYLLALVITIVLLPAALVALFEFSSLKQNEEVIERAYREQLNAILFSVNQSTNDVLSSTTREINYSFRENGGSVTDILNNYNFIHSFFFLNNLNQITTNDYSHASAIKNKAADILSTEKKVLTRLTDFYEVGYFRLEPYPIEGTGLILFVFAIKNENKVQPAAITIDPLVLIRERLDPKIQEISGEQFKIAVFDKDGETVYLSRGGQSDLRIELTNPLPALPEFRLGIALLGETVSELVKERTRENIYFIAIVSFVLLIAGWLVIRILNKQIELANLKSDFVSNVSHEIRTPLSLINMYAETMEMGRVTSEDLWKSYIKTILQETNRLSVMVNKILGFSEIEKKNKNYHITENELNPIVQECYNSYIPYMEKQGFKHELELDARINSLNFDPDAIKDIIINLIDNAIKYSFENKHISIRTKLKLNKACIEVEDKGIGINNKDKRLVFDKFYRVANNDVSIKVKGSGLGLSIVKYIVDAHNGTIEVKSKEGEGSLFRILLPINKIT